MKKDLQVMNKIIVYGAGGFGRETALMIRQINVQSIRWNLIGFCDDGLSAGKVVDGLPVLGGIDHLNEVQEETAVAIAIADPKIRKSIREKIVNTKINFPVLVHPSVMLGDAERNSIGEGTIITAGNILTTNIHIGSFVIINLANTIGHDVTIDSYTSIMPGCSLSGFIDIETEVMVGTGARLLPQVKVGKGSKVGAGAVVTNSVNAGTTVVGVPAKSI
ncbi:acetyltransferase [Chryseosolibacter indicus]|uniref:Acetyltransferase n=1 Tax=Chryseosolibacter indicus TaxID=2782351 RepID=A0ABS5VV81_9BACT|nr:acetyltransferase [Chryseosolibacter indicus]MBT1705347.1 acetyltransferase [Chryseosolibacter indicus]